MGFSKLPCLFALVPIRALCSEKDAIVAVTTGWALTCNFTVFSEATIPKGTHSTVDILSKCATSRGYLSIDAMPGVVDCCAP